MNLRARCKEFYQRMQRDAMLRQGSPVDDLMAFVMSENGRAADPRLERTQALVMYFEDDEGREEMIRACMEAKPGMMTKKMP